METYNGQVSKAELSGPAVLQHVQVFQVWAGMEPVLSQCAISLC